MPLNIGKGICLFRNPLENKRENHPERLETLDRICRGLKDLGGNAPVEKLAAKTGVKPKTIYYHAGKEFRIQLDKLNQVVTWTPVERAMQSQESNYRNTGYAFATDTQIQLREIGRLLAIDLEGSESIEDFRRSFYAHFKDYRRRIDANTNAFLESMKPENQDAFARANLDVVQPSADLGLTRKVVTRVPALSSDWP